MKDFPKGFKPGERIAFRDGVDGIRHGEIIDRAPQGWDDNPGVRASTFERSGYWFWVRPDQSEPHDPTWAVRVRFLSRGQSAGEAFVDHGPMCVRSILGPERKTTVDDLLGARGERVAA